jgi:hypothetical protein
VHRGEPAVNGLHLAGSDGHPEPVALVEHPQQLLLRHRGREEVVAAGGRVGAPIGDDRRDALGERLRREPVPEVVGVAVDDLAAPAAQPLQQGGVALQLRADDRGAQHERAGRRLAHRLGHPVEVLRARRRVLVVRGAVASGVDAVRGDVDQPRAVVRGQQVRQGAVDEERELGRVPHPGDDHPGRVQHGVDGADPLDEPVRGHGALGDELAEEVGVVDLDEPVVGGAVEQAQLGLVAVEQHEVEPLAQHAVGHLPEHPGGRGEGDRGHRVAPPSAASRPSRAARIESVRR